MFVAAALCGGVFCPYIFPLSSRPPPLHRFGLFILSLALQHQAKVVDAGERVWVLWPQYLLISFERPPLHRFGLFILSLILQHQAKVVDAAERVWVLWPQYLVRYFERPRLHVVVL